VTLWTRVRGEQQHCLNPKRQNTVRLLKWYRVWKEKGRGAAQLLPCPAMAKKEPPCTVQIHQTLILLVWWGICSPKLSSRFMKNKRKWYKEWSGLPRLA
ncbi:hypothetical protein EK904_002150, partial [Melospiza melodia maxima]